MSPFLEALPVWLAGREREMNLSVAFRAVFRWPGERPGARPVLRIAAASVYRAFINGEFLAHGPARGPHGHHRVDEWDLSGRLRPGRNVLAVEVAGYNVNSYYLADAPAFLQAEVADGRRLLAATAGAGAPFRGRQLAARVQKVQRYSYQRTFSEVWRLRPGTNRWRSDPGAAFPAGRLAVVGRKRLLPRRVPRPEFLLRGPAEELARGKVRAGALPAKPWRDRALTGIDARYKGYREAELAAIPSLDLQRLRTVSRRQVGRPWAPEATLHLAPGEWRTLDFGTNLTGFPGLAVSCRKPARLYLVFDELPGPGGDVDFKRMTSVNAVLCELSPGRHEFAAFEPYTLRYLKLLALDGACEVSGVGLREYAHPLGAGADFAASDGRLNRLFAAGRETFRQNAVDIFMDCPSRERAGWLCDSFFTARAAADLCGETSIERNFLENYLLPRRFARLPAGMLPMCYPADHPNGNFIPNWALWFVLELEEYLARGGDAELVAALRGKVLSLFKYFERFRNADGLLEKLERWVFIEWSEANKFVQDVNYPTNMLYAGALDAAARVYRSPRLAAEARRVRAAVRRQSFDGEFFVDNAVRRDGRLVVTRNRSEVCQYFAFYFGAATPESHPKLWRRIVADFGPDRGKTRKFPEIHAAAPFIGNVLRLELLSRAGLARQLLAESVGYLLYMAERTGTLWEVADEEASCNHGFASHVCHLLYRDVLGLAQVDPVARRVSLRFSETGLTWCRGSVPVPGGKVSLEWRREGRRIVYRLDVPAGWASEVQPSRGIRADKG
jgi:alpha-L-rhamnosidase